MEAKYLLVLFAVVACCYAHGGHGHGHGHGDPDHPNTNCTKNADCISVCPSPDHAVCDIPSNKCHCHDHGQINCTTDAQCREQCGNAIACCYNDHHCHCTDGCEGEHTASSRSCQTDIDCSRITCSDRRPARCDSRNKKCRCRY